MLIRKSINFGLVDCIFSFLFFLNNFYITTICPFLWPKLVAIIFCEYFEIDLLVYFCSFLEDDDETVNENDAELVKQIEKQRRRAVAAVCGGRKSLASRNSYKESLM